MLNYDLTPRRSQTITACCVGSLYAYELLIGNEELYQVPKPVFQSSCHSGRKMANIGFISCLSRSMCKFFLYGIQEVRGSNPLGSTILPERKTT